MPGGAVNGAGRSQTRPDSRLSSADANRAAPHLPSLAPTLRPRGLVAGANRLRDLRRRDSHAEHIMAERREGASRPTIPWATVLSSPSRPGLRRACSPDPLGRMLQRQGAPPLQVRSLSGAGIRGTRVGDAPRGSVGAAPEAARRQRRRSGDGGFDRALRGRRPALRGGRVYAPRVLAPGPARRKRVVRSRAALLHGAPAPRCRLVQRLPRADRHARQGCLPAASALRPLPAGSSMRQERRVADPRGGADAIGQARCPEDGR